MRLQEIADKLGLRLDRFELVYDDAQGGLASEVYWTVGDLPPRLAFADLGEARRMVGEQLHVRVSEGDHTDEDAISLKSLINLAQCRLGLYNPSACEQPSET